MRISTRRFSWRPSAVALLARGAPASHWKLGRSATLLGNIVYWVVLLFFITAATHMLNQHPLGLRPSSSSAGRP